MGLLQAHPGAGRTPLDRLFGGPEVHSTCSIRHLPRIVRAAPGGPCPGRCRGSRGHPEGSRWGCCHERPDKSTPSAGELLTHTLLVNGNGDVLVLVSIDSDDHLNSADDFATDNCSDFCLLKESASARRVDKTAERLEVSCYEVTVPMAVGAVSAISGSSRQIIWKASGAVSDR